MQQNQHTLNTWKPAEIQDFQHPSVLLARNLLGYYLVHLAKEGATVGKIVETEAYLGMDDAAAHSFKGPTKRTQAMFGPAGHAYIYLSYGIHYCFNVTAGRVGVGEGVLIRALQPVAGMDLMQRRRGSVTQIANGPGKLVKAMGISKQLYGHDLTQPPLYLSRGSVSDDQVMIGPRVGISRAVDLPLRFWIKDNPHISKLK